MSIAATERTEVQGYHKVRHTEIALGGHRLRLVEVRPLLREQNDLWPAKAVHLLDEEGREVVTLWNHNRESRGLWQFHHLRFYGRDDLAIVQHLLGKAIFGAIILASDLLAEEMNQLQEDGLLELVVDGEVQKPPRKAELYRRQIMAALLGPPPPADDADTGGENATAISQQLEEERLAERRRRQERREAKRRKILARQTISFWRPDGKSYWGYPATEEEWQVLEDGTFVVLVDQEGAPLEAFVIKMNGGGRKIKSSFHFEVSFEPPDPSEKKNKKSQLRATFIWVTGPRGPEKLPHLREKQLDLVRKQGLRYGTRFVVGNSDLRLKLCEYRDGIVKLGRVSRPTKKELRAAGLKD